MGLRIQPGRVGLRRTRSLLGACVGDEATDQTLAFASQTLPGTRRLGCRKLSGLIRARRSLSLPLTTQAMRLLSELLRMRSRMFAVIFCARESGPRGVV